MCNYYLQSLCLNRIECLEVYAHLITDLLQTGPAVHRKITKTTHQKFSIGK
jgi:hypothetical protein